MNKLSKYIYLFKVSDYIVALYHSLLIKTVFLSVEEYEMLKKSLNGENTNIDNILSIINYLKEIFFIANEETDAYVLDLCRQESTPLLESAYIIVTEECNFNCKYCFVSNAINSNVRRKNMTRDTVDKILQLLINEFSSDTSGHQKVITFYGGEPLLNFDIIEYFVQQAELMNQNGYLSTNISYMIITNGALISEKILSFVKRHNISLTISYDSASIAQSNRVMKNGKDSYVIVKEKMRLCRENSVSFSLSITLSPESLDNQDEIINELLNIMPSGISYNMLVPNEQMKVDEDYYERATDFMIKSFETLRQYGIYEDRMMRKVKAFSLNQLYFGDCCAAGGNQIVVTPNGEIGICHAYINNKKFFDYNLSDSNFQLKSAFPDWVNRSPLYMGKCQTCEALGICGGGCGYAADYMYGSINEIDTRFCIHTKKILNWMIHDLYKQITQ